MSRKLGISRRSLLKGLLGGAVITVALPPLEAFWNSNGTAYADTGSFPKRFGVWFWGNGVLPAKWVPDLDGTAWLPSEQLMPLAALKQYITVVSGLNVMVQNSDPHGSGPAGLFTGDNTAGGTVTGPSIDQIVAAQIGGDTRFRSLEIGVERSTNSLSFNGPNEHNPPETSPWALFNRLFGAGFRMPGDMSLPDPRLGLRRSVLDAVTAQAGRLRTRLGATDRARLDQHLDGIRTLETQLDRLQQSPPSLAACMVPAMPMMDYPDIEGRTQMSAISRAMSDLMVMALACDQTRVFFNMFSQPVGNVLYPNAASGHHQLTHDEAPPQSQVNAIVISIMQELAYFLDALRRVTEGTATLLDHCAILATTDTSLGQTHSIENYPIIIGGNAGGILKNGIHYRSSTPDNAAKVSLSLLRAMGLSLASFGTGAGQVTQGLSAIEV